MTSQPDQRDALDRFFDWTRSTGIRRRLSNRHVAGVCGGIADRFGIDPMLVRLGFVVLTILGGAGVTLYLVAFTLLADTKGEIPLEKALRRGDGNSIILLVITSLSVVSNLGFSFGDGRHHWLGFSGSGWLVVALIAFFVWRRRTGGGSSGSAGSSRSGSAGSVPGSSSGGGSATTSSGWPSRGSAGRPFPAAQPMHPAGAAKASSTGTTGFPYAAGASATATSATAASASAAGTSPTTADGVTAGSEPTAVIATDGGAGSPDGATVAQPIPPNPFNAPPNTAVAPVRRARRTSLGLPGVLTSIGLAIVGYAATTMSADAGHWSGNHVALGLAVALGTVSALVALLGAIGRRAGFAGFAALLLAGALAFASTGSSVSAPWRTNGWQGASDVSTTPTSLTDGQRITTSMGDATLDLSRIDKATLAGQDVVVSSSMGDVTLIVPTDLGVTIVPSTRMGKVTLEQSDGGTSEPGNNAVTIGDGAQLHIAATTSMGDITIKELAR